MQLEGRAREHVPALAGVLSLVSLALVFGAVLQVVPAGSIPRAPAWLIDAIPHVNAFISLAAIGTIAAGWRYIKRNETAKHRASMLASLLLFVAFLVLYLYKVTLVGPTPFPGPETVYRLVYLPLLAIHIGLAIVCVPLLYYVLLLALTRPVAELPNTPHRKVGRVAASLWLISFALGVVVYAQLYLLY
jgi:putative membrane protein